MGSSAGGRALQLSGLHVRLGGRDILSGIDLRSHPGELVGVIGPSGAGKSTLIRSLLGTLRPTKGTVTLAGAPIGSAGPVGYVPQDDALHRELTPRQSLSFAAALRLHDQPEQVREERVAEVAASVGLAERMDVRITSLSGGQRKRVAVAMELLTEPDLLILDEPTSGLDPGLEAQMMHLFGDVAGRGRVVWVATHAMASLDQCQALLVLVAGCVSYFGPPAGAAAFFGAAELGGIFSRLPGRKPAEWAAAWAGTAEARRFAHRGAP